MRKRKSFDERFWEKVDVRGAGECWPWKAAMSAAGYGVISRNGKVVYAHRTSWQMRFGVIRGGLHVCHKCDDPGCCNPNHFFLGRAADNMADMAEKGRVSRGDNHCHAKLTAVIVAKIKRSDEPGRRLARRYGVTDATICDIRHERTWRHVGVAQ